MTVAAIDFVGFDAIPADHLDDLKKRMPLKVGEPRDRQLVVTTHEMALNELRDHGYPVREGRDRRGQTAPTARQATLDLHRRAGKLAHFGPIEIVGQQERRRATIIRARADVQAGRSVSAQRRPGLAAAAVRDGAVSVRQRRAAQPGAAADEVPIRVTVAEGNHQRVNFGVGYGTEEKARVDAEYHHVNFLGGARSAGAHGRWSSLDRGVRARFQPAVFLRAALFARRRGAAVVHVHAGLRSVVTGGKVTVTHRAQPQTSWSVSITSERSSSSIAPAVLNDPSSATT